MSTIEIVQVAPTLLAEWHAVMRAAYTEDQGVMWWESLAHLRYSVIHPHSRSTRFMFAAIQGGECIGALELMIEVQQPDEPVQAELGVRADQRGRGVGRALAAHGLDFAGGLSCTTVQAEVFAAAGQGLESTRGGDFLERQGFEVGNVEDRMLLDLPWADQGRSAAICVGPTDPNPTDPNVTTRSWTGPCPTQYELAWAGLAQQMEEDVPLGDLARGDTSVDVARMREDEQRSADRGWLVLRTMALLDGRPCGYTELMVDPAAPVLVVQDDTLVDRAVRRRGIGRALKSANLDQLSRLPPGRYVQTYTAQQNVPMQRLNEQFGFRKVGTLHDAELHIAGDN